MYRFDIKKYIRNCLTYFIQGEWMGLGHFLLSETSNYFFLKKGSLVMEEKYIVLYVNTLHRSLDILATPLKYHGILHVQIVIVDLDKRINIFI